MPFLSIAGIEVFVTEISEGSSILIGDEGRSFSGTLRGDITAEKRVWTCTGLEITRTEYEALRDKVKLGTHVAVSGDAIPGGTRTMRVRLTGGAYERWGSGFLLVPALTMEEV